MAVENRGGSEQSCLAQQSPGEGRGPSPGGSLQGAAQMIPTPVPGEPQSPPLFRGPKTQVSWSSWTATDDGTGGGG